MIPRSGIVALDGHDGAGKTTLARALAERVSGSYRRPFHGPLGAALLDAAARGDFDRVITLGEEGIRTAAKASVPVVLDRGWMTVASLIDGSRFPTFAARWHWWIPTALCWADLPTTLERLGRREDAVETTASHRHYLAVYRDLAERTGSVIVRTDVNSTQACVEKLAEWFLRDPVLPVP
jgi:energy-coupling factor transporter ATP-binding protein EcfA2